MGNAFLIPPNTIEERYALQLPQYLRDVDRTQYEGAKVEEEGKQTLIAAAAASCT